MKPESNEESSEVRAERNGREAITRAYREASNATDERPDPRVRAAVLAAAARAVNAKPRDAARTVTTYPFAARRWPLSAAALVVVSIMTGLVVTRGWWERPDLVDASQPQQEKDRGASLATSRTPPQDVSREAPEGVSQSASQSASQSPPQAPSQRPRAPFRNAAPASSNAPSELAAKTIDARRSTARAASPRVDDVFKRNAPALASSDMADASSASAARQKAEASSTNTAVAVAGSPAAPADVAPPAVPAALVTPAAAPAAPNVAQRAVSRLAGARGNLRAESESQIQSHDDAASPEAWIERIVKLREAGQDNEASRELARFKRRYPNFTIPREALHAIGTR